MTDKKMAAIKNRIATKNSYRKEHAQIQCGGEGGGDTVLDVWPD